MASKKPAAQQEQKKNVAKTPERSNVGNLPSEMDSDLVECFNHYKEEGETTIPDYLFRNILQNFGFHKMGPRDIEEELKKSDPEILKRNAVDLTFVRHVVTYHWNKGIRSESGRDEEAKECFRLFDKRDRQIITAQDIKPVLAQYLPFPPTDQDVMDFIAECDKNGTGHVTLADFKALYLS